MTIAEIFAKHGEALFPRRRGARDRPAVGQRPAGAGDRRRLDHGPAHPRPDPHQRHLGLAEGRSRRADEAHQAAQRPPAGGKDQGPAAAARAGLCAVRHRGAVARRAARHHRRRNHRRCWQSRSASRPTRRASHDRAAAPRRLAEPIMVPVALGDARLRHRHRPRADRHARRAHQGAAAGRQDARSSPTRPWPSTISPPPRPRSNRPASKARPSWCRKARAPRATRRSRPCARRSSRRASSAAIWWSRSAAA